MKNIFFYILGLLFFINNTFASKADELFIKKQTKDLAGGNKDPSKIIEEVGGSLISNLILYVAFFAVLALVISGFMFMLAGGEEEKVKKAKNWVIWSLVGVVASISAYGIIEFITKVSIELP